MTRRLRLSSAPAAMLASAPEKDKIQAALWPDGKLSRTLIARDADVFARGCGLPCCGWSQRSSLWLRKPASAATSRFPARSCHSVLAVYRARDFDTAITRASEILAHQGGGHSVGLHTRT